VRGCLDGGPARVGAQIERACGQIAPFERRGGFRCDAVTHTLVVMLFRQLELALDAPHGALLHPGMTSEDLENAFGWALEWLRRVHGEGLFPDQPAWPGGSLRRWVQLWHGVDMIGRYRELDGDVIALVFQHAAGITGKQDAWGAYYTPWSVCWLMAAMLLADSARGGRRPVWELTVLEPACGAGSMLVAVWEQVRQALLVEQREGRMTAGEAREAVRRWVGGVSATDIDGEAAWCCAAQLAVRTGVPVAAAARRDALGAPDTGAAARHPYRGADRRPGGRTASRDHGRAGDPRRPGR
jgi:hypothetical protein